MWYVWCPLNTCQALVYKSSMCLCAYCHCVTMQSDIKGALAFYASLHIYECFLYYITLGFILKLYILL